MRISYWSSDVCSSDLFDCQCELHGGDGGHERQGLDLHLHRRGYGEVDGDGQARRRHDRDRRNRTGEGEGWLWRRRAARRYADDQQYRQLYRVAGRPDRHDGRDAIGGATCGERVCQYGYISVVAVPFKKKKIEV